MDVVSFVILSDHRTSMCCKHVGIISTTTVKDARRLARREVHPGRFATAYHPLRSARFLRRPSHFASTAVDCLSQSSPERKESSRVMWSVFVEAGAPLDPST